MRGLLLATGLILATTATAQAEWSTEDGTDEAGRLFLAYSTDADDVVEWQVLCDERSEHRLEFLIFTGEPAERKKALGRTLPLSLAIDGAAVTPLTAQLMVGKTELYFRVDEDAAGTLRQLVPAMAKADTMVMSYADTEWTFDGAGAKPALAWVINSCTF